jgi:hypothetical protein
MEQQQPPPLPPPPDLTAPQALRMMLIRRYSYPTLKFSSPAISESGRWEASWNGGCGTIADTEGGLLARVLEESTCPEEGTCIVPQAPRRSAGYAPLLRTRSHFK